jgi:hypothetical protein
MKIFNNHFIFCGLDFLCFQVKEIISFFIWCTSYLYHFSVSQILFILLYIAPLGTMTPKYELLRHLREVQVPRNLNRKDAYILLLESIKHQYFM